MKIKNFINLCNLAKKILVKYKKSNYILAIRQLYLMRPHPVLLKEYYKSEEKIDKNVDGKNFLLRIYNLFKEYLSDTNDIYSIHPIKRYAKKMIDAYFYHT